MIQEIITYAIILTSISTAIYRIYKSVAPIFSKKKTFSCSGGCSTCSLH